MATKPVPKPELSHGSAIEYKAFARSFQGKGPAVLYLFATCYYPTGGYTIFFESRAGLRTALTTYAVFSATSACYRPASSCLTLNTFLILMTRATALRKKCSAAFAITCRLTAARLSLRSFLMKLLS